MAIEVGTAYITIIPSAKGFASKLQSEIAGELRRSIGPAVEGEGDRAGRTFGERFRGGARSALGGLGSILKTGLAAATVGLGVGLAGITAFGLKTSASLEQTQISFESLTGSVAKGQAQFKELQQFASVTPFQFTDLTRTAGRFDAMAKSIGQTQQQLIPFLTTIGNVVSVTGGGAENLDSVSLALSQITSRGKLTLDNINQLSNALPGFSGVAALAAVRGETQAQVMDEISAGTINASDGVNQLLKGMQQFPGAAGAMEKQSQTLLGVFSTFKDTVGQALSGAFQGVIPQIKNALTEVTPIIGQAIGILAPALGGVLAAVLPLIGQIVAGIAPILAPILDALGPALAALGPAIGPLANALTQISKAIAPILPLAAELIATLVEGLSPIIQSLTPLISGLVTGLVGLFGPLMPVIIQLASVLTGVLAPVFKVIGDALAQLGPVIGEILGALGSALAPLLNVLAPLLKVILDALSPLFPVFIELAKPIVDIVIALTPLIELLAQLLTIAVDIAAPIIALGAKLLALLASKAIAPLIEELAKGLTLLLSPLSKLIGPLDSFGKWINSINWASVGKAIGGFFVFVGKAIGGFFADLGKNIGSGLSKAWHAVVDFGAKVIASVITAFATVRDKIATGIANAITFVRSLPHRAVAALASLGALIGGVASRAWSAFTSKVSTGVSNAVAIAKGLPGKIISGISSLIGKLVSFASGLISQLVGIGSNIISGIIQGIENSGSRLVDSLLGVAKRAFNAVKNFLGIGSPSKLFAELGMFTIEGYAVGIEQHAPRAHAALVRALQPPTAAMLGLGSAGTSALATAAVRAVSNSWTINAGGTTIGVTELVALTARHDALQRADRSN